MLLVLSLPIFQQSLAQVCMRGVSVNKQKSLGEFLQFSIKFLTDFERLDKGYINVMCNDQWGCYARV